jgi:hypothetical protein
VLITLGWHAAVMLFSSPLACCCDAVLITAVCYCDAVLIKHRWHAAVMLCSSLPACCCDAVLITAGILL